MSGEALNQVVEDTIKGFIFSKKLKIRRSLNFKMTSHEEGKIERFDPFDLGFSVGLKADIASLVAYETFSLKKNEGIVLYTDGITQAQNLDEEQYGIERLCEAQAIQQAIISDVKQYIGTQKVFDDMT